MSVTAPDAPRSADRRCANLSADAASAIADELVGLTTALSELAYDLGSHGETVRRHMGALQSIDLITQIHLSLADLLRSSGPFEQRLEGVVVEALGQRLRQSLAQAKRGGSQ
ncbi:hypothetical protein [Sphingomonas abietis]|uniref:Chemotaxis protein n=1 Tax=Sphingomonas abietis TaxID=3012344 RepID=A0ABY7NMI6_9SPHN|nr:hypothetical protein [Sphingomonas abietis]WBO20721.1 hypothetical protein PBT88_10890 [Sphingomonas abietis]